MAVRYRRPFPLDVIIMRSAPALRIGAVLHFTGVCPPVEELRTHLAKHLALVPALSAGLVGTGMAARWQQMPVNVAEHVRRSPLPVGGEVEEAVCALEEEAFPSGGPQWDMTLLTGYEPGRYAIVYRVNHGLQDMGGVAYTLESLFSTPPVPAANSSAVVHALGNRPRPSLRHLAQAGALLARSATSSGWPLPGNPRSGARTFRRAAVPTDLLRAISRPYGGSANDAYVAAMARATATWTCTHLPHTGSPGLPLTVGVNIRRPDEADAPGNYVVGARLAVPGHVTTEQCLRTTVAATALLKPPPRREALRRLTWAVPYRILHKLIPLLLTTDHGDVVCSSFALRRPLQWQGDPVVAAEPLTTLPAGIPVAALLLAYQGRSSVHFVTDPALPGMDMLHRHWLRAVHEQACQPV
ncbi:wax ester/triacylglycerol synthase domain-containing protein [Streptomyces sp. NPDC057654]|uniref:wax ester/triacylglycerol synthase domain-containing protein n=1 Tax=Streptomyces sp. NPDC057654 TaxID=3346196 RepID=UPI00368DC63B